MRKVLLSAMILAMMLCLFPVYSMAEVDEDSDILANTNGERAACIAVIMQGNTYDAADCVAFENAIEASGNSYISFTRYGWLEDQSFLAWDSQRVTEAQLQTMRQYHVAYYSGHGGPTAPILNYQDTTNNPPSFTSFGVSSPINIATALGVSDSNWASTCIIKPTDNLKVLVLAACSQLNDNNAKYYARVMKASGMRAVVGYWGTAPSWNDATIAQQFIEECDGGNSVRVSWDTVNDNNGNQPWAVLVYSSNGNADYRLPGFPGTTYAAPSSTAAVYRYKSDLSGFSSVTLNTIIQEDEAYLTAIETLPLTIAVEEDDFSGASQVYSREAIWNIEVNDSTNMVVDTLEKLLGMDVSKLPSVEFRVTREEIDADTGVVPDSRTVVERTYKFFDTYKGIKIADSFVSAVVDGQGINSVSVQRKNADINSAHLKQYEASAGKERQTVSASTALKTVYQVEPTLTEAEIFGVSLAYVPDKSGNYVLCYEFAFSHGFRYVSVESGKLVYF